MLELALFAGSFVLAAVATALLFRVRRRTRASAAVPSGDRDLRERLDASLAEAHPVERTHLERPPRLHQLATRRGDDGQRRLIPVIRVELGSTEPPSETLAFEFVASVLEAVHPLSTDEGATIEQYDVQFRFGPDGLFVSRSCFRVAVPVVLAVRLVTEDDYRAHELRRDVKAGDDGDEETPPVLWGDCRTYRAD